MDTAHWSSTPCEVLQDEMALTDEKHSGCLVLHNIILVSPIAVGIEDTVHMMSDFNTGIVS